MKWPNSRLQAPADAPERLPDDVIEALTAMRDHNRALNQLRYFSMAKSDVEFHKARVGILDLRFD